MLTKPTSSSSYDPESLMGTTATAAALDGGSGKKVRKPYTISKSRESWTDEEHDKFLEALQLFDRDWKKIEDFVGSKTVIQIRSHAQKYFLKVQKSGNTAHVPPPRPKRKATHPYPQKASKNGYSPWDETSVLIHPAPNQILLSHEEYTNLQATEADIGPKRLASGIRSSSRTLSSSEIPKQGKQVPVVHGIPDFAQVYSFIGSVFDPDTKGHAEKLRELDPITFETVLLLMRNLSIILSSPDFEPVREVLVSYDVNTKTVAAGIVARQLNNDLSH